MSKAILKAAARYIARLRRGERIMRDANGHLRWAAGGSVAPATVAYLLGTGEIAELDTDLFGESSRGQTIGIKQKQGA